MTTKPNEPEGQMLVPAQPTDAMIDAALTTGARFGRAAMVNIWRSMLSAAPAQPVADAGGVTEDDVIGLINIVTDLAEVDALDKAYPEVWGRLDAMVNHAVAAATAASEQIRLAAHKALGEWLAWPDAARDGPAPVDDSKVLSWLGGVAQKLGTIDAKDAEIARLREALTYFANRPTVAEVIEGKHDPMPDTVEARIEEMGRRKREHDEAILQARAALSEAREAGVKD